MKGDSIKNNLIDNLKKLNIPFTDDLIFSILECRKSLPYNIPFLEKPISSWEIHKLYKGASLKLNFKLNSKDKVFLKNLLLKTYSPLKKILTEEDFFSFIEEEYVKYSNFYIEIKKYKNTNFKVWNYFNLFTLNFKIPENFKTKKELLSFFKDYSLDKNFLNVFIKINSSLKEEPCFSKKDLKAFEKMINKEIE